MHQPHSHVPDWDPFAGRDNADQLAVYDDMRERCPVAYSDALQWSLFRHDDILRVITDHQTFSNNVSQHLSVPNGMDPPEHTVYRAIVAPYFSAERMQAFEPHCRQVVSALTSQRLESDRFDLVSDYALDVAVGIHCAFLGWPSHLHVDLASWTVRSRDAAHARDQDALSLVSREFQELVADILRQRHASNDQSGDDVMASLMRETVHSRPLDEREIASILRNWTVGEIGTMSASVGILVHYLAVHPDLQVRLRSEPSLLPAAIDEILRIQGPLVTNRRVTTTRVQLEGRTIEAGERLSINWIAANRDERIFDDPTAFSLDRDPAMNLLYGAGIHICPGAPLARMELRLIMEELLARTTRIELDPEAPPLLALYPASGYASLPVLVK